MEVTTADDHILVGEDDGVVGGGVDFGFNHRSHVGNGVFSSTVHLWGAAEAVGVLHMLFVAADYLAALGVATHGGGSLELAFVRAHLVEALVEGLYATVESVEAQRQKHIGLTTETLRFHHAPHGVAAHELGAVQQGKAFLAL